MRALALIVLIAMIAAAAWLLKPELFQNLAGNAPVSADADPESPPGVQRTGPAPSRVHTQPAASGQAQPSTLTPATTAATSPARELSTSLASDTVSGSVSHVPETAVTTVASASQPLAVAREAQHYVQTLSRTEPAPVSAERADHFVSGGQVLKLLPDASTQLTSLAQIARSTTLEPDSPITVIRNVEQVERASPDKLIADSVGNLDAVVQQVLADESIRETTVRAILEKLRTGPQPTLRVLRQVEYFEQTTPRELLADRSLDRNLPIKIVKGSHGRELASVRDLIMDKTLSADTLFYVRTVRASDVQGIWGIVHDGIIKNFARGIAIRRGREINTYKVDIPHDADEARPDLTSSFLGRLIYEKSKRSYVYNLRENRMGRNPDRIIPGQEIIIIDFEPDELIGIYKQFVNERG